MPEFQKLGLLGHPLAHALSPVLQDAALQYAGIKGEYGLFDIKPELLTAGIKDMLSEGVRGFNVTIPHKERLYKMMDNLTKEAGLAGAVNTVKVESGSRLVGHNTDIIGFKLAIKEAFGSLPHNKNALIIGAGGSARAVVVALSQLGFKNIRIKGRNPEKVRLFIAEMQTNVKKTSATKTGASKMDLQMDSEEKKNFAEIDLVVNASPIGLKDEAAPEWLIELIAQLSDHCVCFDLVYSKNGKAPTFTQLAEKKSLKATDGLPMLVHQARYAFQFWTGVMVPSKIMYAALKLH